MTKDLCLSSLSYLLFEILAAIDRGYAKKFSFETIYSGIESGTIFQTLEAQIEGADFSSITTQADQFKLLTEELKLVVPAFEGRECRKTGIDSCGLCLLGALLTEMIQQYHWDTARDKDRM